jgi:peptide-methionine (S)-S-oxide reductase
VVRTRVGYAGGTSKNPTYFSLDGHSETCQIDYDATIISYGELLDVFWDNHDATWRSRLPQYMSVIFCHNREQRSISLASKQREEVRLGTTVATRVVSLSEFYLAEDYHQKYYLQQVPELVQEFRMMYPDIRDFVDSTAATRVNAFVAGYGTLGKLQDQLASFGLSPKAEEKLLEIADN